MREHPGGLKVHSIQSGRVVNHAGQFRPGGVFLVKSPGLTDGCLNDEIHYAEFCALAPFPRSVNLYIQELILAVSGNRFVDRSA